MIKMTSYRLLKNDTSCVAVSVQSHAYLFDALLILDEKLDTWDVNMKPRPLRRTLHWSVYTTIVLATHTQRQKKYRYKSESSRKGFIYAKFHSSIQYP